MQVRMLSYEPSDVEEAIAIWNAVVEEGVAFPQEDALDAESGDVFFASQSYTGIARDADTGEMVGLFILHPNNVGRCGHIANASYAVREDLRGQHIGEQLVRDSLRRARELGFRILQFNAVVEDNTAAVRLYEQLGFHELGRIPGGFHKKDGSYATIILYYYLCEKEEP